ncbi:response regulator [Crocosphaera sp. Alani8]|uniref:response regulator n=1 Tax=Crocosphaera sp. Alani8 TaxID=3038952 RepID=UPI00313B93D5
MKKRQKNQKIYKILIVDSEIGTRHLLTNYFNKNEQTLTAVAVGSVAECLRLLWVSRNNLDIDIVLVSSYLSGKTSGIELIEIIRQLGFFDLPIFLLSKYDVDPELERLMFAAVRGIFNKTTVRSEDIAKKLKRYIKEVIEYEPNVVEDLEKRTVETSKREYKYDLLRWKSPRGKFRGASIGSGQDNDENESEINEQ